MRIGRHEYWLYAEYAKSFFGEDHLHGIPGKAQFNVNAALKMLQAVPAAVPRIAFCPEGKQPNWLPPA
jgi:hypothetical protein